jgi:hypothetical protein
MKLNVIFTISCPVCNKRMKARSDKHKKSSKVRGFDCPNGCSVTYLNKEHLK